MVHRCRLLLVYAQAESYHALDKIKIATIGTLRAFCGVYAQILGKNLTKIIDEACPYINPKQWTRCMSGLLFPDLSVQGPEKPSGHRCKVHAHAFMVSTTLSALLLTP